MKTFWEKWRCENQQTLSYETPEDLPFRRPTRRHNAFDRLEAELQQQYLRPGSQDELDNYLSEVSYGAPIERIVQWWLSSTQTKRWPQLSRFAVDILLIPPMSAKPEVVFSGGRRTIGWERTQLSSSIFEAIECEKDWIRSGILRANSTE